MGANGAVTDSPTHDIALGKARATAPTSGPQGRPWVGLVVGIAVVAAMSPFAYTLQLGIVTTLTTGFVYAVVALGWNLLGGYGGYMNFGVVVLTGSGTYTAALLNQNYGWSIWAGVLPAMLGAVLVALPVGIATLRLRGYFFAIFTLVLTFLAQVVVFNSDWLGTALGVYTVAPADNPRALAALFYLMLLGMTVVALVISFAIEHSRFGYALRAIREDEEAATVLGVRAPEVKLRALLIGAALAGAAGAVLAFRTGYIEPTGVFSVAFSLDIVLVCVIGGMGSWYGPLIGAFIVVLLEQWLRTTVPELHPFGAAIPAEASRIVLGLLLIAFALYARRGVAGMFRRARGRWLAV